MQEFLIFISTNVAGTGVFVLLLLLVVGDLYRRKLLHSAQAVIGGALITAISVIVLKNLFHIPRPDGGLIEIGGYGFPSGHATVVVFLATVLWFYLTRILCSPKWVTFIEVLLLTFFVGWSRLYLGVHTPAQVLGGYVLGAVISALFLSVVLKKPLR